MRKRPAILEAMIRDNTEWCSMPESACILKQLLTLFYLVDYALRQICTPLYKYKVLYLKNNKKKNLHYIITFFYLK